MKPINNKSLLHFIFDQMEKLDKGETDVNTVKAQAQMAKQANNTLKYELDRTKVLLSTDLHNRQYGTNIELRNAEGKNFDK